MPALTLKSPASPSLSLPSVRAALANARQAEAPKGLIVFDRVTKRWASDDDGEDRGLFEVSFTVLPGEFVFVVGRTGSGKTTLLRLLHGKLRADSGTVTLGGLPLETLPTREYRQRVGLVAQTLDTLPNKTVAENIELPLQFLQWDRQRRYARVEELLRTFNLSHRADTLCDEGTISGGERQRLAIARAIVHQPDLLLCDEPTGQVDLRTSYGLMRLLNQVSMSGTTVLCVTHDPALVNLMAKRVLGIDRGRLVSDRVGGYPFR